VSAYYNEIDPFAVDWLKALISEGHIAPGDVDDRSITDVQADDLNGYTQAHFFAGIGVWSYALRQAGITDDTPVWTGSCPCQPFSAAGRRTGTADERHLWPQLYRLVKECRPPRVLGEQVAGKAGAAWFDLVQADLAQENYAAGMVVFPACGIGAPHQRQRLYWVAEDTLADSSTKRSQGGLPERTHTERQDQHGYVGCSDTTNRPSPTKGYWADPDWLYCRDDKWRPVESSTFPLAHGATNRVGRLRGYGNAIVAPQAQVFIKAVMG
jgi:DNA (cytosine-5)-methyltransferase 1